MYSFQISSAVLIGLIFSTSAGIFSSSHFFSRAISPDNTCGFNGIGGGGAHGYTCPSTLPCCSANGFCGSTDDYCLSINGCQSQFGYCTGGAAVTGSKVVSTDATCGITGAGTAGYTCPTGVCCSNK